MSHEIEKHDSPVYHAVPAWHGLGTVVEDAPTPLEALPQAKLEWNVGSYEMYFKKGDQYIPVPSHAIQVREDITKVMSVTSDRYRPVQNKQMAEFCELLSKDHQVKVESAGSLRDGEKVWFLLKGEGFDVGKGDDTIYPYILVSNGHDGNTSFRVTPTTVRVVCANTLHMVIPRGNGRSIHRSAISIRHSQNIDQRVDEAQRALAHYQETSEKNKELMTHLRSKSVTVDNMWSFFLECYSEDFGAIPDNPKTADEERSRQKAKDTFAVVKSRFEEEEQMAGHTMWNAFNSYSWTLQHGLKIRTRGTTVAEKRLNDNLFGVTQDRTFHAFKVALKLAS